MSITDDHDSYHQVTIETLKAISSYMDSLVTLSGSLVILFLIVACLLMYETMRK